MGRQYSLSANALLLLPLVISMLCHVAHSKQQKVAGTKQKPAQTQRKASDTKNEPRWDQSAVFARTEGKFILLANGFRSNFDVRPEGIYFNVSGKRFRLAGIRQYYQQPDARQVRCLLTSVSPSASMYEKKSTLQFDNILPNRITSPPDLETTLASNDNRIASDVICWSKLDNRWQDISARSVYLSYSVDCPSESNARYSGVPRERQMWNIGPSENSKCEHSHPSYTYRVNSTSSAIQGLIIQGVPTVHSSTEFAFEDRNISVRLLGVRGYDPHSSKGKDAFKTVSRMVEIATQMTCSLTQATITPPTPGDRVRADSRGFVPASCWIDRSDQLNSKSGIPMDIAAELVLQGLAIDCVKESGGIYTLLSNSTATDQQSNITDCSIPKK